MIKKYILGALMAFTLPVMAYAATPMLMVSGNGDNTNVTVTVTGGEPNAPVVLYSNPGNGVVGQQWSLGTTDQNGRFTGTVTNTGSSSIAWNSSVYVQVAGYQSLPVNWVSSGSSGSTGSNNNNAITFSQASPILGLGQNGSITLSGGNGIYYVSSNSNSNGVSATLSGNTLTLYGAQAGQANIVICSTSGGCGTLNTTVNNTATVAPVTSQSTINVNQNGQGSITLSGGMAPYTISVPSGSGVSTTMVGNTLYINGGANTGMSTIQVCSANNMGCTPVSVNVQSGTTTTTPSTSGLTFSLPMNVGISSQLVLSGGSGSYYLASPMSSPALASINGNTLTLNGSSVGNGTVTVCSTAGGACLPIAISVSPALTGIGGGYFYDNDLWSGQTSQDVMELQTRLAAEGFFTATPTGYFGPLTMSAVMAYQSAHGISATGYVGPMTRAMLNQ